MYKISAVIIGIIIALMVSLNGILAQGVGQYESVFIIHLVGLIGIIILLIIRREKIKFKERIPIYLFSAGAIGVFVVLFNSMCINKIGVSLTLALGLFGQSIAAVIIDHFGILGMEKNKFEKKKLIGFAFVFVGILLMAVY